VFDRRTGELRVLGAWGDTAGSDAPLASLHSWLNRSGSAQADDFRRSGRS
jgi:hypothetical protein